MSNNYVKYFIIHSPHGFSGTRVIYNTVLWTLPDRLWHCLTVVLLILLHNRGNILKTRISCNTIAFPQPTVAKMESDSKRYFTCLLLFLFDLQHFPSNTKWYSNQRLILHKRNTMDVILKVCLLFHGLIPHTKTSKVSTG